MNRSHTILALIMVFCTVSILLFIQVRDDHAAALAAAHARRTAMEKAEAQLIKDQSFPWLEQKRKEMAYHEAMSRYRQHLVKLAEQRNRIEKDSGYDPKVIAQLEALTPSPPPEPPPGVKAEGFKVESFKPLGQN